MLAGVRLTEFHERVALHFGAAYGSSVLLDHVLTGFDGRSAAQAIEDGVEPPRRLAGIVRRLRRSPRSVVRLHIRQSGQSPHLPPAGTR